MTEVPLVALKEAIRSLHGCDSRWLETVSITETFRDATIWDGFVQVMELIGHPSAVRCYAWTHGSDGSQPMRFVVVLHQGAVDSPEKAVLAAIVQERRERQT